MTDSDMLIKGVEAVESGDPTLLESVFTGKNDQE